MNQVKMNITHVVYLQFTESDNKYFLGSAPLYKPIIVLHFKQELLM